ncbi:hypothetical protein EBU99_08880 [bacterium]|nr:hypothetical protein [bacterium]
MLFSSLPADVRDRLVNAVGGASVAFPEGDDPRVQAAAELLKVHAGVSSLLLKAGESLKYRTITEDVLTKSAQRRGKPVSSELLALADDPFFSAGALLEQGQVDAVVGGAVATTAHVIRAALNTVGVQADAPLISSCFLFKLLTPTPAGEAVVLYADAGVIPQPSETQLTQIAALAARAFAAWTGRDPRVGFLSFSTFGSAQHADVLKMRSAAQSFAQNHPEFVSEGELQFDAAVVPEVARRKNPNTRLAGRTNVFIFPDLDAGNISYKITQRLAGAEAWGPLLLGTAKPFSDLSRGASAEDIAHVALLTLALGQKPAP